MKKLPTLTFGALLAATSLLGQMVLDPPIVKSLDDASTVIEGQATGCPGGVASVSAAAATGPIPVVTAMADGVRGTFRIVLSEPRPKDEKVIVSWSLNCGSLGAASASADVTVKLGTAVKLDWPIKEGQGKITGSVSGSVAKVRVFLIAPLGNSGLAEVGLNQPSDPMAVVASLPGADYGPTLLSSLKLPERLQKFRELKEARKDANKNKDQIVELTNDLQQKTASDQEIDSLRCAYGRVLDSQEVSVTDKKWDVTFRSGLDHGLCVLAQPSGSSPALSASVDTRYINSVDADWGRLRGTFAAGVAVGQSNGSFTQADPYLSFYTEAAVWNGNLLNKKAEDKLSLTDGGFAVHLFTEGRLSQSAVVLPGLTDPVKASTEQKQSVWFQMGAYVPLRIAGMDWWKDGHLNTFTFGPLVKYGASWVDGGVVTKQTVTSYPAELSTLRGPVAAKADTVPTNEKQALPFYGGGARFGFYRYELLENTRRNRQLAPELLGYLDYIYGQDKSLQTPFLFSEVSATSTSIGKSVTGYRVEPRHMLEARLKLPNMPVMIGLDASFGARGSLQSPTVLRFVITTRVDAASAIGKLFGAAKK